MAKDDADDLQTLRHDAAHVMATAVLELWPEAKISIGPPIADGFYSDFEFSSGLWPEAEISRRPPIEHGFYYAFEFPDGARPGEEDLARIEERMRSHVEADEP